MGEPDKGEAPGDARPGERADQGWSALDFRVEPESGTKEGESRTCQRSRIGAQQGLFSIFLVPGFFATCRTRPFGNATRQQPKFIT